MGPTSSVLVKICFTVRMQESEVQNQHSLDYRKSLHRILMKFYGELGCGLETNWLHFGDDLHHCPDPAVRSGSGKNCHNSIMLAFGGGLCSLSISSWSCKCSCMILLIFESVMVSYDCRQTASSVFMSVQQTLSYSYNKWTQHGRWSTATHSQWHRYVKTHGQTNRQTDNQTYRQTPMGILWPLLGQRQLKAQHLKHSITPISSKKPKLQHIGRHYRGGVWAFPLKVH